MGTALGVADIREAAMEEAFMVEGMEAEAMDADAKQKVKSYVIHNCGRLVDSLGARPGE